MNILHDPSEVDSLIIDGKKLNSPTIIKDGLKRGAIAFCVFVGEELANISWVAVNKEASGDYVLSELEMNWDDMAVIGPCLTIPKFRGMDLYPYVLCRICLFLNNDNIKHIKITSSKRNTSSIRGITKAGFRPREELFYFKLFMIKRIYGRSFIRTTNQ